MSVNPKNGIMSIARFARKLLVNMKESCMKDIARLMKISMGIMIGFAKNVSMISRTNII